MDFRQNTPNLLSHTPRRLLATGAALVALAYAPSTAHAVATPPSRWVALAALPGAGRGTIFGLAVDPANSADLVAGDSSGAIYRSIDAGSTWSEVFSAKSPVLTIAYDPLSPNTVLAGTSGAGVLLSRDTGAHWTPSSGTGGRSVRAVAFAHSVMVAATDHGVFSSADGAAWSASGLTTGSVDAIAVLAVNDPVRIVAGGDSSSGSIPMWASGDGGVTWTGATPAISGTMITRLAAGPLAAGSNTRLLVVGTNTGLFVSADGGSTYAALSGADLLPSIDYTQVAFTGAHFDRFYAASDGGGFGAGGLWATADAGHHFSSLQPPVASVTALAVTTDEQPVLYVATFRGSDHASAMWAYRDTGGTPQGPSLSTTPSATSARTNSPAPTLVDEIRSLGSSQTPYIAIGVLALLVILMAAVSHFRSRRR
jgi:hypothetical protein